jgi:hypothetical protein
MLVKWAVDSSAKEYWSNYYKEYGKAWVRDIPRRVKKAMLDHTKTASVGTGAEKLASGVVTPVGTSITDTSVVLEGMFRAASGENFIFCAEFDHEGAIKQFDTAKLSSAK